MTELLPLYSTEKDYLEEIKSELGNTSEQLQTLLAKPREELRPLKDKGKSLRVTNVFKTEVEPRAAGEWFHCKVLNILWRHFYVL